MRHRVWVLGAPDPEMEAIEGLLRECGETMIYSTDESGRRVHPGNAYRCPVPAVPEGATVYAVECIDVLPEGWVRIDHHRPGDPGYGRPPAEFLAASSIGQVITELAHAGTLGALPAISDLGDIARLSQYEHGDGYWETTTSGSWAIAIEPVDEDLPDWDTHKWPRAFHPRKDIVLCAAADHCLSAAYRGECPGVDPDALMRWRLESRARFQRRDPADLLAQVEQTRARIRELAVDGIADLTGEPGGTLPEAPEAAAREGVAVIARVRERDGRQKLVLLGAPRPDTIRKWMEEQRATGREVYGDPLRGFAGAYL